MWTKPFSVVGQLMVVGVFFWARFFDNVGVYSGERKQWWLYVNILLPA